MVTFDEILKAKLQEKVPAKNGKMIDPTEAMVYAVMNNAMKGDIASIAFIRNMTKAVDPEAEKKAKEEHIAIVNNFTIILRDQLKEENAWDGQTVEVAMLAEIAAMVDKLSVQMSSPDFQEVITDPRTGKQTVSPLIQLRDQQRELFDKQLAKLRQEAINRKLMKKSIR